MEQGPHGANGQTELSPAGFLRFLLPLPDSGVRLPAAPLGLIRSYDKLSDGEGLVSIATGAMQAKASYRFFNTVPVAISLKAGVIPETS